MSAGSTLLLGGADIRAVVGMEDCIAAVERVLRLHAEGKTPPPGVLSVHVEGGGFHVKAAAAALGRDYFAAKSNGNFPANPGTRALPTIQGVIVLCDATDGRVLALTDSIEITTLRTAAATAVAAKHLARPDSSVATVVGCGVQGRAQLVALATVLPLVRVFAVDLDEGAARRFAGEMTESMGISVIPMRRLPEATLASDVCVTCTPSHRALLGATHVRPGTFVAGVGADHPEKHELDPDLFRGATVVVDVLEQCLAFGDLHHAVAAGVIEPNAIHAELGEIVIGSKPGRTSRDEITVFDSTGTALQDVATAALAYERAVAQGRGWAVSLDQAAHA